MKYLVSALVLSLVAIDGFAAQGGRLAMSNKIMAAPQRYTASINQLNAMADVTPVNTGTNVTTNQLPDVPPTVATVSEPEKPDPREAERDACINNNIGFGNTFVWASRYSDTTNYANMVEDVTNPQNNVCFVRVELKSEDESRISVSDIGPRYFMWGENIECGSWANKKEIEKRILDAKKTNRVLGIVASSVGGAGIGVGAMELFGNRLIGGAVEGQRDLSGDYLYRSQLLVLQKDNPSTFRKYQEDLRTIKRACDAAGDKEKSLDDFCNEHRSLLDEFGV